MATSLIDLTERADLRALAELVAAIREANPNVRPLLVGAMARDILLTYAHGIPVTRGTEDIDFAFAVADWEGFEEFRGQLLASHNFVEVPDKPHCLLYNGKRKLDLIPFGGVEREDRTIAWPPQNDVVMQLIGFREAMPHAHQVELIDGESVLVVSLPALAMLKVFAWQDRRLREPGKDAGDLLLILSNYLDAGNRDRLFTETAHLLDENDFDYRLAGAWMLGFDVRKLLRNDGEDQALKAIKVLLAPEVDPERALHLVRDMSKADQQGSFDLLKAFYAGLTGENKP